VATLLPVLRLAIGPAAASELTAGAGVTAGAGAKDDAGLLGEAAVGALSAAKGFFVVIKLELLLIVRWRMDICPVFESQSRSSKEKKQG